MYHLIGNLVDMFHQGWGRLHITTHILASADKEQDQACKQAQPVQSICASTVVEPGQSGQQTSSRHLMCQSDDTLGSRSVYAWGRLGRSWECHLPCVSCCCWLHAATCGHLHWVCVHETLIGVPSVEGHSCYLHNAFCFIQCSCREGEARCQTQGCGLFGADLCRKGGATTSNARSKDSLRQELVGVRSHTAPSKCCLQCSCRGSAEYHQPEECRLAQHA